MSEWLVLMGAVIVAASGFAGLPFRRGSLSGQWLTTLLAVFGAGLGLAGVGWFWKTGESRPIVRAMASPGDQSQRGDGWLVGHFSHSGLLDIPAGKHLRAELLEANRASRKMDGSCACSTA